MSDRETEKDREREIERDRVRVGGRGRNKETSVGKTSKQEYTASERLYAERDRERNT